MPQSLWSLLQKQLRQHLNPEEFATWFRPLKAQAQARDDGGKKLVLLAPNSRFLHILEESYRPTVDRALAGLGGPAFEVLFSVAEEEGEPADAPGPELGPLEQDHNRFPARRLSANFGPTRPNSISGTGTVLPRMAH